MILYDGISIINFRYAAGRATHLWKDGSERMSRRKFDQLFPNSQPVVTPVIHVQDAAQALRNLDVLDGAGCPGAFLINHDFEMEAFLPILREVRAARPDLWLGVNFLAQPGHIAFPVLGSLARAGYAFDAYWADDGRIDERKKTQTEAEEIGRIRAESAWEGLYLGGVAFKKQRPVPIDSYALSAEIACGYMDVVCTSGTATGQEADPRKIETFRAAIGDVPLAVASGITPENVRRYVHLVDMILVASGINYDGDFYNIDPARLDALLAVTKTLGEDA
ncbi:BtpA/SgcQ family protein [Sulfitobacter sp. LCG007]